VYDNLHIIQPSHRLLNRPFVHFRFDLKIIRFYTPFYQSYFPCDRHNGTPSRKSNEKDNKFEYNFLIYNVTIGILYTQIRG
jgi:hypothetical protein